ncbi:MAG TPA: membrane-bound lytic murein transglycosylase MltF [Desulfobacteraceae bacterium]|nr:membrane-bound lytic murein transglycosylase MltF [Desulfobacteraceae bacterium]
MKKIIKDNFIAILFVVTSILFIATCIQLENASTTKGIDPISPKPPRISTLEAIKEKGKIRMITDNNANAYYMYRGVPMGFEYDMAKAFAAFLHVDLEVLTPGWNAMFSALENGRGDFIASGLTITDERENRVAFSSSYLRVQQKLIHHKLKFGAESLENLAGKTIHVRKKTSYQTRLEEIKNNGVDLTIQLHDNTPTEELIRMVANREIKYTVADSNIALLNRRYYPDITIGLPLEEEQSVGWAVKKENTELLNQIDQFLSQAEGSGLLGKIYEKYYSAIDIFDYFDLKKFHQRIETRLPKYKATIVKESEKFDFDWRMVAAIVYQESHYDARAKSRTGVRGLMQVTRKTAQEMGIKDRLDPRQSIQAGVRYLHRMYQRFDDIENRHQRLRFAMASYNVGYGHVRDAQKLAEERGLDKNKWKSMETTLPLLTKRKFYKKTKHGYARGREPVQYIERIETYYDILKQKAKA